LTRPARKISIEKADCWMVKHLRMSQFMLKFALKKWLIYEVFILRTDYDLSVLPSGKDTTRSKSLGKRASWRSLYHRIDYSITVLSERTIKSVKVSELRSGNKCVTNFNLLLAIVNNFKTLSSWSSPRYST